MNELNLLRFAFCLPGTAIEVGLGRFKPAASTGSGIQDELLLKDVMNFCLEGGASTIDLASAKARFVDADMASLERCCSLHLPRSCRTASAGLYAPPWEGQLEAVLRCLYCLAM
jgi:hypothetical protein